MRLQLGPIIGHTDNESVRIWIRTLDDPSRYVLRIKGKGLFPFQGTSAEFRTAIAIATELRSDRRYHYQILRRGRVVNGSSGSFVTMPQPGSFADVQFVAVSCSDQIDLGAWERLSKFIDEAKPRFLIMMGDQVYMDQSPSAFEEHLFSKPKERRKAMADKYQQSWSREPIRRILANIPTYFMWDDHDIRDGWGSFASDSPSLAARYSNGRRIFESFNTYFEDARDLYWHFQMSMNPPPGINTILEPKPDDVYELGPAPASGSIRSAMPIVFRCGRMVVLMLDSRGERDLWRKQAPVLGSDQWKFIESVFESLQSTDDALVIVTPAPIVAQSPTGVMQWYLGRRTDDVEMFKKGDIDGLLALMGVKQEDERFKSGGWANYPGQGIAAVTGIASAELSRLGRITTNYGGFKLTEIDDARDQWSNFHSRPEQERLIRKAGAARLLNRTHGQPRGLIFIGGDLHAGGIVDLSVADPEYKTQCIITSGISKDTANEKYPLIGTLMDKNFEVAPGIHATLREFVNEYNFGIIHMIPTGGTPNLLSAVSHKNYTSEWEFWYNGASINKWF